MDELAGLLDGPRARGAFLLRCVMAAPWAIRIQDRAPLCLTVVARGHAWVLPDGGEPVRVEAGDVVINRGPDPYTFADDPVSPTVAIIEPGQRCVTPDGEELAERMALGVRTWGNAGAAESASTVMLTGTYLADGEVSGRLLRALPPLVVLRGAEWSSPLLPVLGEEIVKDERVALAADLLREPEATIGAVARQVGYSSPFALSTAFKRVQGVSPREYRARSHRAGGHAAAG